MRALAAGSVLLLLSMLAGCRSLDRQVLIAAPQVAVTENADPSFAVGVVPMMAPPVRIGAVLGFRLSSSLDGYGHLYVISATGDVTRLTENLPWRLARKSTIRGRGMRSSSGRRRPRASSG